MPGKVIQSMKKAKKTNPLFLLDEIDKMGGFPRRSVVGAAGGARSGAEQRRSTTITSRSITTCRT
jgi:hypothetical protein